MSTTAKTTPKTTPKAEAEQPEGLSVKQLAEKLKIEPKDLRKWLRAEGKGVGQKGKRYSFTKSEAATLARAFKKAQADEAKVTAKGDDAKATAKETS